MRAIPHLVSAPLNPIPAIAEHFRRSHPPCVIFLFSGGLTAVIYTDTLCTFLMVVGSLTVMGIGNDFVFFLFCNKMKQKS